MVGNGFLPGALSAMLIVATLDQRASQPLLLLALPSGQRFNKPDLENGSFFRRQSCRKFFARLASAFQAHDFPKQSIDVTSHSDDTGKVGSVAPIRFS